jgi:hypothetical protein
MVRTLVATAVALTLLCTAANAQDAKAIVSSTSKALGADGLNSISLSGSASNVNFGQTKNIQGTLYARADHELHPRDRI